MLQPIIEDRSTFGECYFKKPFEELEFESKLRVVADILRQSVLPEYYSDPDFENSTLVGDCHLSSRVAIDYLKYLGVGVEHDYVLVNRRPFDPPEKDYSKHAIVIVTDEEGDRWQIDSAPWMGYGYGTVSKEGSADQIIDDYTIITEQQALIIDDIKRLRIKARDEELSDEEFAEYAERLRDYLEAEEHLKGFVGEGFSVLAAQCRDFNLRSEFADLAISLDPYRGGNKDILPYTRFSNEYLDARSRLHSYVELQCEKWQDELDSLRRDDQNLERRLQLAQWIVNERKFIDNSLTKTVSIDGEDIDLTMINPRFMAVNNLNTAIIKPSAFRIGCFGTVREELRNIGIITEYDVDPTEPTSSSGTVPLLFSHALAAEFERSYTGRNRILLVRGEAEELHQKKQLLRSQIGNKIMGEMVMWTDGQPIEWHPFSTNYLHTTDNPQEASLHFLLGAPEYSVMNRWMYPNPKLL